MATDRTLRTRIRLYKATLIAVLGTVLCCVIASIGTWSLLPLAGIALVFPLCFFYLFLDSRAVKRWHGRVQSTAQTGAIDIAVFKNTIQAVKTQFPVGIQSLVDLL